jgi:hypothetical protein
MSWKFDTLRGKSLYEKGLTVKALGKRISISRDIDARKIEWSLPIRSRTKFKLRNLLLTGVNDDAYLDALGSSYYEIRQDDGRRCFSLFTVT